MSSERYGVFRIGGGWKVFRNLDPAGWYPSREQALEAACASAREVAASGAKIEILVETWDGQLALADLEGAIPTDAPR